MSQILDLSGEWKLRGEFLDVGPERFQEVLERPDGPFSVIYEKTPNAFPVRTGFLKAQVPCDVTSVLIENGIIKEPLLKENSKSSLWIMDLSWWFIKTFQVDGKLLQEDMVRLYIEMLDFKANIILNGKQVACHTNAFCPFCEDVKRYLKEGENTLVIRLTTGLESHYPKDSLSFYCASPWAIADQRVYLRKPQFTHGWDWCRPVPTCGIGRAVRLEAFSGARAAFTRMDTLSLEDGKARVRFAFELEKTQMCSSQECVLEYELLDGDKTVYEGKKELLLVGGLNLVEEDVVLDNPKLWWPNGYGDQALYTLRVRCSCAGKVNAAPDQRVGVRTVEIDQSKLPDGTRNFFFKINGVRVFCKGGNWIPTDSVYLRASEERYRTLVAEAKDAGFTMIRIWGGGLYEPDCFYEACSENGILLMHDFMYACGFYPDLDHGFLFEAQREAEYQTRRLAHYPCMAVWTGNNEIAESYTDWFPGAISPERFNGEKIFNYLLPLTVRRNSPTIPYMPSTPYFGDPRANQVDDGDVHAWTYFGRDPKTKFQFQYELEALDRIPARFISEFGFSGAPMESTVRRYFDGDEIVLDGDVSRFHRETLQNRGAISRHLTDAEKLDLPGYLLYSGVMQGCMYAEMGEAMRQKPYGAGNLIWMYNDCWPETGCTVIDYYLTRKISFYFLKRAYSPKKLMIRETDGGAKVTVLNDGPQEFDVTLTCGYMDFSGRTSGIQEKALHCAAHSWQQFTVELSGDLKGGFFFASAPGFETADSLRAYYRDYSFPQARLEIEEVRPDGDDLLVTVSADAYVPLAYLKVSDDRVHFSDNYFKLYPHEKKTVRVENCSETPQILCVRTTPAEDGCSQA